MRGDAALTVCVPQHALGHAWSAQARWRREDALVSKKLGFSGKVVFDPDQIVPASAAIKNDAAARCASVALVHEEYIALDLLQHIGRITADAAAI